MELIKFPFRARVLQKKGLDSKSRRCAIDLEIREIDAAIAALRTRKRRLLTEYRKELYAGISGSAVVIASLMLQAPYAASSVPLPPSSIPLSASSSSARLSTLSAAIRFAIRQTPSLSVGSRKKSATVGGHNASASA